MVSTRDQNHQHYLPVKRFEINRFFLSCSTKKKNERKKSTGIKFIYFADKTVVNTSFGQSLKEHLKSTDREIASPLEACVLFLLAYGIKEEVRLDVRLCCHVISAWFINLM